MIIIIIIISIEHTYTFSKTLATESIYGPTFLFSCGGVSNFGLCPRDNNVTEDILCHNEWLYLWDDHRGWLVGFVVRRVSSLFRDGDDDKEKLTSNRSFMLLSSSSAELKTKKKDCLFTHSRRLGSHIYWLDCRCCCPCPWLLAVIIGIYFSSPGDPCNCIAYRAWEQHRMLIIIINCP